MVYRKEIDGLRALAVIPVIFFHAGFESFKGGFVGVDIFFVISGYLITSLLIEDIEKKQFSLISFYERRARRLLPALFFLILCCIPFAWKLMLPDPLENFGQSLVATSIFSNNILLFATSGYWDLPSEFKPLYTHGALVWKNNITFYFHCYFCSHGSMGQILLFLLLYFWQL